MLNSGFGGAERIFVDTCIGLANADQQVLAIIHPRFTAKDLLKHKNIKLFELSVWSRYGLISKLRLAWFLRKTSPDIIHVHLRKGMAVLGLLGAFLNINVVTTMHNYGKVKAFSRARRIIALTPSHEKHIVSFGYPRDNVDIIPNFSLIKPLLEPRAYKSPRRFLAFGRFVKKKGFSELINAIDLAKKNGTIIYLSLGGNGRLENELKKEVLQKGLQDQIKFIGWVDNVIQLLDEHDVFVLPSLSEPFGIVLLEAMARRLPIISTLTEGPKDFLNKNIACLCEPGNVKELAMCLCKLAKVDDSSLQNRANNGSLLFKQEFSSSSVIPKLIETYKKAMD